MKDFCVVALILLFSQLINNIVQKCLVKTNMNSFSNAYLFVH